MRAIVGVLCCLLAGPAWADAPGSISTSATARARLSNTVAEVILAVQAQSPELAGVEKTLGAGSERLMTFLRGAGVERLRTQGVSVLPDIDGSKGGANRIVGYSGQVRVTFRMSAERLGAVVAGALQNGANSVESTVLQPSEAALEGSRRELETEAVRQALADAKAVAEAAGRKLGAMQEITIGQEGSGPYRQLPMRMSAAMPVGAAPPPIATEAGETPVAATVSIKVALIEP